jgi:8-oxo-dGTP pyrophosphatase MutT (NUDIX family)
MSEMPPPGSIARRVTARVLPVDPSGRILLLHGWEPRNPHRTFWFTIGGALDDGEDHADAAIRELAEEVGITVDRDDLTAPLGTWDNAFDWGDWRIEQTETWYAVGVDAAPITLDGLDESERNTTDRAGWWTPDELAADGTAVVPDLPNRMQGAIELVHGERR